jgi:opacity protein-like surface antigen
MRFTLPAVLLVFLWIGATPAAAQQPKPKPKPKPAAPAPKPTTPKPVAKPTPTTQKPPVKPVVPAKPPEPPIPKFTVFGGGAVGTNGYGIGFLGGAALRLPIGKTRFGVVAEGSYAVHKRNEAGGGPEDVSLDFVSGTGSLRYDFHTSSRLKPYILAGAGVHYAKASTTVAVTPNSASTVNLGGHGGFGLRLNSYISAEARMTVVKGFSPISFRLGFSF